MVSKKDIHNKAMVVHLRGDIMGQDNRATRHRATRNKATIHHKDSIAKIGALAQRRVSSVPVLDV